MNRSTFTPVLESDRISSIDLLRGVAVLGILIMNIQHFSMPTAAYINPSAYGDLSGVNRWVWILSHLLASGKFMSMFSMLFGAGVLLFTHRAEQKGLNSATLHFRRMGWLLLFGMMHGFLLWTGDILVTYSLCGMLLFLFRNLRPDRLLGIALAFFLVPILINIFIAWSMPYWPPEAVQSTLDSWMPGTQLIQHQLDVYRSGWLEQMEIRVPETIFMQTGLFLMGTFWRVMAMMLLGMALYKWGVLSAECSSSVYIKMTITGLAMGLLLSITGILLNFKNEWTMEYSMFMGVQFNYLGSVGTSLGYVGLLMLISQAPRFNGCKKKISAVGRMAFSNYILMTLLCTSLFYGHGLGLYGYLERKYQVLVVLVIWALMLVMSPLVLKRFQQGPLEWIWRALTYRKQSARFLRQTDN
jgi:uncharacterized protein